jgi:hypothetical protein
LVIEPPVAAAELDVDADGDVELPDEDELLPPLQAVAVQARARQARRCHTWPSAIAEPLYFL